MKKHFTKLFAVFACISFTACGTHAGGDIPAELTRLTSDIAAPSAHVSVSADAYIRFYRCRGDRACMP